jgi:hypothetical protein
MQQRLVLQPSSPLSRALVPLLLPLQVSHMAAAVVAATKLLAQT